LVLMRTGHDIRNPGIRNAVLAAVTAAVVAAGATGCSDTGETPESVASKAGEAVASATGKVGEVLESASAAASSAASRMAEIKGGLDAKGDVKLGPTKADGNRVATELTVTNLSSKTADYTVLVNWKDADGNVLDATVVSIDEVPVGGAKSATARSNRDLSGTPTAEVAQALRH
ncbi:hypothetical protein ACWGI8_31140, partial [Streptomyces sp. NPDC054841]